MTFTETLTEEQSRLLGVLARVGEPIDIDYDPAGIVPRDLYRTDRNGLQQLVLLGLATAVGAEIFEITAEGMNRAKANGMYVREQPI